MTTAPDALTGGLTELERHIVEVWWDGLDSATRLEVAGLCDSARDSSFFRRLEEGAGPTPMVLGGRFLAHDDAWGLGEWGPDYFEYMLDHPEDYPVFEPITRTLHIGCVAHADARACLTAGLIPADFRCPVASPDCPIGRLLDATPGRSVRLVGSGRYAVALGS